MNRMISIFLLVLLLMLSACSSKTFSYSGETENWSASLEVTQNSNDYETQKFVLEYKGDNVSSVGKISYKVKSVGYFGKSGVTLREDGTIRDSDEANPTNAKVTEHTEVEVKVEWNGEKETFKLSKQ